MMKLAHNNQNKENIESSGKSRFHRNGIYLLPNLLTTSALFAGFYAIIAAMSGRFEIASVVILIAIVFDGLDGRVARLTNTESNFGAHYDSLSDMVSFGVAPAVVLFEWSLSSFGKVGWLTVFIYTASVALRLARFNSSEDKADNRFFSGLPSPAGAATLAAFVWFCESFGFSSVAWQVTGLLGVGIIAGLMVSELRFYSFKNFDLQGKVPFVAILSIVLIFVLISIEPPLILLFASSFYALSGPIDKMINFCKQKF